MKASNSFFAGAGFLNPSVRELSVQFKTAPDGSVKRMEWKQSGTLPGVSAAVTQPPKGEGVKREKHPSFPSLQRQLADHLALKVALRGNFDKGSLQINFSSKDEELKLDFFYSFGENLVFIFDDQNSYNNFFDSRLNQILLTSHVFYVEYEIEGEKRIGFCDFNLTFYRIWNAYLKTYVKSCEENLIQGKLNFQ